MKKKAVNLKQWYFVLVMFLILCFLASAQQVHVMAVSFTSSGKALVLVRFAPKLTTTQ